MKYMFSENQKKIVQYLQTKAAKKERVLQNVMEIVLGMKHATLCDNLYFLKKHNVIRKNIMVGIGRGRPTNIISLNPQEEWIDIEVE